MDPAVKFWGAAKCCGARSSGQKMKEGGDAT